MQSHPIKFKCGHEKALPLDETGKALKKKIRKLERERCPICRKIDELIELESLR